MRLATRALARVLLGAHKSISLYVRILLLIFIINTNSVLAGTRARHGQACAPAQESALQIPLAAHASASACAFTRADMGDHFHARRDQIRAHSLHCLDTFERARAHTLDHSMLLMGDVHTIMHIHNLRGCAQRLPHVRRQHGVASVPCCCRAEQAAYPESKYRMGRV